MALLEKILFIADSPSDLLPEQIEGLDIRVAPVMVTIGGVMKQDFFEIDRREFWKELPGMPEFPVSSMVTPDNWIKMYRSAQNDGYTHVLVITLSGTASGTLNSAKIARDLFLDEGQSGIVIEIADSRNYSFLYGRMVLDCAEMAKAGVPFQEILDTLLWRIPRNQALLWVYSLAVLKRSGRITGIRAFVGEALGFRPILWIRDGLIAPVEQRIRGDKAVVPKMIDISGKYIVDPCNQDMVLLYNDVPEAEIIRAEQLINEHIRPRSLKRHPIGVTITMNCGPQAMALGFYGDPIVREEG